MAGYPPPYPPPGYDRRAERRFYRDQARAQRAAYRAQREQMRYEMRGMRRSSIVGPLLLIAVGVVFLLMETGRLDAARFWGWYGRWWPLLLVIAGLVALAEWALDQVAMRDPQRPRYRRSIGGGVVVLVLLLIVTGAVAGSAHQFPSGWMFFPGQHFGPDAFDELFGDKHESDQAVDLALAAGASLAVVNPRGDVTISGTSDDNRIHIAVHKQIYARSDAEADSKEQQFSPRTSQDGATLDLSMPALEGARADLVIQAPPSAVTSVTADRGDVHVSGMKAGVGVTANRGDIELSAITGPVMAHLNSSGASISAHSIDGPITIQGHAEDVTLSDIAGPASVYGEYFGTTLLEHIDGQVHFHTSRTDLQMARLDGQVEISPDENLSADQAMGPLVLTTRNRNITLDRVAGAIAVTNRNGAIDVTAAPRLGDITLTDRNGNIKVTVPEDAGYTVEATTNNGNIDTGLPLQATGSGSTRSLSGTVAGGGPLVRISTSNGDILLGKAEVQPLPAGPPAAPKITLAPPAAAKTARTPAGPKAAAKPSGR